MMSNRRAPPRPEELLDALGAALGAGATPAEALKVVAAVGPASARTARLVEERLAGGLAAALVGAQLLGPDERAVVAVGESQGRAAAALAWVAARRRLRRERRRVVLGAVAGPLAFIALTLLADPLPQLVLGTASFGGPLRNLAWVAAWAVALLYGVPRLLRRLPVRALAERLPVLGNLLRLDDESAAASVAAAFAGASDLGAAPAAARGAVLSPMAEALAAAAADPQLRAPALSESFGLALAAGARSGDLPARLAAFHASVEQSLLTRLRVLLRVIAFAAAAAVAVHSAIKLFSTPLGGDLGNLPEMHDLDRELDSLMK